MPYANEERKTVAISAETPNQDIISAPGVGYRLAIDHIVLNASGGANTVTLTGNVVSVFDLTDNGTIQLQNSDHDPEGVVHCDDNQAFNLILSSETKVTGFVRYRIIG